jgi:uncharacterized low-complexity protein
MKRPRKLLIAALAAAAMLIAAQAVLATKGTCAQPLRIRTRAARPTCCTQATGSSSRRVTSRRTESRSGHTPRTGSATRMRRRTRPNGRCGERKVEATRGRTVNVRVCLVDRDKENVLGYFSPWKKGKA